MKKNIKLSTTKLALLSPINPEAQIDWLKINNLSFRFFHKEHNRDLLVKFCRYILGNGRLIIPFEHIYKTWPRDPLYFRGGKTQVVPVFAASTSFWEKRYYNKEDGEFFCGSQEQLLTIGCVLQFQQGAFVDLLAKV